MRVRTNRYTVQFNAPDHVGLLMRAQGSKPARDPVVVAFNMLAALALCGAFVTAYWCGYVRVIW